MGEQPNEHERYRHECEVREWYRRYRERLAEQGLQRAKEWLRGVFADIAKKRGAEAADRLRAAVNALRAADQPGVGKQHSRPPPRR
ncbi:MAG: hypothetical protein LCH79_16440 [Proteobacteria bacterium]|nr:hypothetical protein [Pseudomonadota bacterium]